jgi:hypothetical protein
MAHKHIMAGLDHLFKDLMQYDRPFGGNLVVTSGDFIHNLPITPGGLEEQRKFHHVAQYQSWDWLIICEEETAQNQKELLLNKTIHSYLQWEAMDLTIIYILYRGC